MLPLFENILAEDVKYCPKCKGIKRKSEFGKDKSRADGLYILCKECNNAYNRQRVQKNKDKIKIQRKKAKEKDPERFASYWRKYNKEHHDRKLKSQRAYYLSHKDEVLKKGKEYRDTHVKERQETCRRWWKNNPEKANAIVERRRARKLALDLGFDDDDWEVVKKIFDYKCAYCGEVRKLTQDHFVPLSKQGPHVIWNMVAACMPCNYKKNRHAPEKWVVKNFGEKKYLEICAILEAVKNATAS